jgi:hypothetical protein
VRRFIAVFGSTCIKKIAAEFDPKYHGL